MALVFLYRRVIKKHFFSCFNNESCEHVLRTVCLCTALNVFFCSLTIHVRSAMFVTVLVFCDRKVEFSS